MHLIEKNDIMMENNSVFQFGKNPIYIERNEGNVYLGDYVSKTNEAFTDESFELHMFAPQITPQIKREEVGIILNWIAKDTDKTDPKRVALLYGSAGVGKSVVMHDVLLELEQKEEYLVLGLKTDQIEFGDTEDLSKRMHLAKPLVTIIKEMAQKAMRVVVLIDQIDALSLSLSSNRTPLRSIFKLIEQIKSIPHVRVVISCRPYDLEYDPILNDMKIETKWELKKISSGRVKSILKSHNLEDSISEQLLAFLGNPLHLYLYLKVMPFGKLRNPITEEVLYDGLWRIFVIDIHANKREKVLKLLDAMVDAMYRRQELFVHKQEFESNYNDELNYLLSNGLLLCTSNGRVQFFHQTMFDYIYARRFVENDYDLLKELSNQHQGLFSRAAVKSIFSFLRETNLVLYIHNMNSLLFDKGETKKYRYRFHLKSLILSNMVFFDEPKQEELQLIDRKIFANSLFMGVIFESIHNSKWLDAIWRIIDKKGGWTALSKEYKEKTILMCSQTLWDDADNILEVAFRVLQTGDADGRKMIIDLVRYQPLKGNVDKLIKLYKALELKSYPLECPNLLKLIIPGNPKFVGDVLKDNVLEQLNQKEKSSLHIVDFTHEEEQIFEMMESNHHELAIQLYVELLEIIMKNTRFDIPGHEIIGSFEFSSFQRVEGERFCHNFPKALVNKLIDDFLKNIDTIKTQRYLQEFCCKKYEAFLFIALYVFTKYPEKFYNDIYKIIVCRSVLSNAPCWVEYQALEALKSSFQYMSAEQQSEIVHKAESLNDVGERRIYDKEIVRRRLQVGYPICDIDLHRGKVLYALPKVSLLKYSKKSYFERLRIGRKFEYRKNGIVCYSRLENEMPFRSSCRSGWTSLGLDKARKMSCKAWYKSMTKYVDNIHSYDFERPSLEGQSQLFRQIVAENPKKYLNLLDNIVADDKILLCYAESGVRGLLDVKKYVEANRIFDNIVKVINNNANSEYRGFGIHSFLYVIDDFLKGDYMPKNVFDFLCNVVLNVKESKIKAGDVKEKDIYNTAINQARGHAAYMLIECYRFKEYQDEIFDTLENIASTASVYTRSAILLNMALLNHLDQQRNVLLFKMLLHDYDEKLLAMPIHNYNPLVYFINYAVDDILDVFVHAIDKPWCYKEQVIILWLAWVHNNYRNDIKVLLDKMCEKGQEARLSLLSFLTRQDVEIDQESFSYILFLMSERFCSAELGHECDIIFRHVKKWTQERQDIMAKTFVESPLSKYTGRGFIDFLAGYAIKKPVQALYWLECVIHNMAPNDYSIWNSVTDVLIQSYNGIRSFNDIEYQSTLEYAMDLIDSLMMNKDKSFLITNFIHKLDDE